MQRVVLLVGVGLGGFLGTVARFVLTDLTQRMAPTATWPWGTWVVNISGCLLIGVLGAITETREWIDPALRPMIFVGILGGFTTFSALGLELFTMLRAGDLPKALLTAVAHVVVGVLAVWVGFVLAAARAGS